jgi:hypothetical protein
MNDFICDLEAGTVTHKTIDLVFSITKNRDGSVDLRCSKFPPGFKVTMQEIRDLNNGARDCYLDAVNREK